MVRTEMREVYVRGGSGGAQRKVAVGRVACFRRSTTQAPIYGTHTRATDEPSHTGMYRTGREVHTPQRSVRRVMRPGASHGLGSLDTRYGTWPPTRRSTHACESGARDGPPA